MEPMRNMPEVKMGIVGVSRDCFPIELAKKRLEAVLNECKKHSISVIPCSTIIESEKDAVKAAGELEEKGANAVTVYLGNFGPEGPTTIFAKRFGKPFMLCAAAEESKDSLVEGRGDAFCGMLNASLNAGLRGLRPYIPAIPAGLPEKTAGDISYFKQVARVILGMRGVKVFSFGPRPQDFYACNAPIKPLYDLGVEVMENSELDLYELFKAGSGKKEEINAVKKDMEKELGEGNKYPEKLEKLARFEVALTTFYEQNLGSREFGIYANKCWPAFEGSFGFVPCFINSRLAKRGIPVACEVDIYGSVSEYMAQLASFYPVTILDVNNTVPEDLEIPDLKGAGREDLFMGFHCGNTPSCLLSGTCEMKYQLIMKRLMEPEAGKADITAGTLEGRLREGPVTVFRLQPDLQGGGLMSYAAEGNILEADPHSFGGIGVFGIKGFARFYRYVLIEKQFPHHTAVAFKHVGRVLYDAVKLLGVEDVNAPLPRGMLYPGENPFLHRG